jgi:hypothetical protein
MRLSGTPSVSLRIKLDRPTANLGVMLVDYGQDTRIHGVDPSGGQGLKLIDGEDRVGRWRIRSAHRRRLFPGSSAADQLTPIVTRS